MKSAALKERRGIFQLGWALVRWNSFANLIGIGWYSDGRVCEGYINVFVNRRAPRFITGDVLGLMVDCSEAPKLLFFVNGAQVGDMVISQEMHGKVLFPVFKLRGYSKIEISPNPDLPAGV